MSKGALAIMTKNLAFGLMRHGIRVNQVNPGWMDTESEHRTQTVYDGSPENWLELAEAGRPMGRLVKPWEVANMIAFCLSDESGRPHRQLHRCRSVGARRGRTADPRRSPTPSHLDFTLTVRPSAEQSDAVAESWFLKIDGVQGESTDISHKDEIDVLSWSWGVAHPSGGRHGFGWWRQESCVPGLSIRDEDQQGVARAVPVLCDRNASQGCDAVRSAERRQEQVG